MQKTEQTTTTKKLYGGRYQDITTYTRNGVVTRISYSDPYEKTCDQETQIRDV